MKKRLWAAAGASVLLLAMGLSFSANANSLPDHIVNGDFSYPSNIQWTYGYDGAAAGPISGREALWTYIVNGRQCADGNQTGVVIPGFEQSEFGWKSTQPAMSGFGAGAVEIQSTTDYSNQFAEIVAEDGNYAIYQDIEAEGDSVLYWQIKHAPRGSTYTGGDTMQVKIGPPGRETASLATRLTNNGSSDPVGATMYTIKTTKPNNWTFAPWESYEGRYVVPGSGKQTIRFTFNANAAGSTGRSGNLIDDVVLARAHHVSFNSNGGSAISYNPRANNYAGYKVPGTALRLSGLTSQVPTRSGYTFLGWSEEKLDPVTSKAEYDRVIGKKKTSVTLGDETKVVYAMWAKNPNISFTDRGTTVATKETTFGGTVSAPGNPSRTGYDFSGWNPVISDHYYENASLEAKWTPRTYTLTYEKNNPSSATMGDSDITLSRTSQQTKYDSPWGTLGMASKPGYTFLGWYTAPDGGTKVTAETICRGNLTVYAHWKPIEYVVRFLPNTEHGGDDPEVTGTMPSIKVTYDEFRKLPANVYQKTSAVPSEDEGGGNIRKPSIFTGWSMDPLAITPSLADEAGILNLTRRDGDTIDLYAIWDDAPKFQLVSYPDRYFTLEEAQGGDITPEELLKTVVVYDRETHELPKKPSGGPGPGVSLVNYDPEEFVNLPDDSSVSVRYKVEDASGNTAYVNIMVHVSRNGGLDESMVSYYRSISEPYAGAEAGSGGLSERSRWRMENDPAYAEALARSFDGTRTHDLCLSKESIAKIRSYVDAHGFGNSETDMALSQFWDAIDD